MAENTERIYGLTWEAIYPMWLAKVERKNRTAAELDEILTWLTNFTEPSKTIGTFEKLLENQTFNEHASLIKGVICGVRVEEIQDPIVQKVRQIDKVVDELAKGRKIEKIKR